MTQSNTLRRHTLEKCRNTGSPTTSNVRYFESDRIYAESGVLQWSSLRTGSSGRRTTDTASGGWYPTSKAGIFV